jgi:hypothetical protein
MAYLIGACLISDCFFCLCGIESERQSMQATWTLVRRYSLWGSGEFDP